MKSINKYLAVICIILALFSMLHVLGVARSHVHIKNIEADLELLKNNEELLRQEVWELKGDMRILLERSSSEGEPINIPIPPN